MLVRSPSHKELLDLDSSDLIHSDRARFLALDLKSRLIKNWDSYKNCRNVTIIGSSIESVFSLGSRFRLELELSHAGHPGHAILKSEALALLSDYW